MDIEAARVFAEAFSGVGEGATLAFVAWVAFDFAKETLPYAFWAIAFLVTRKPIGKFCRAVLDDDKEG